MVFFCVQVCICVHSFLLSLLNPLPIPPFPHLTCGALAVEGVDLVDTPAVVHAGVVGALVRIDLAELPLVAWPISKGGGEKGGGARGEYSGESKREAEQLN